jgi:Ala-tRNA(Pro) deacylase
MSQKEFDLIVNFLKSSNIAFEHIVHEHVHHSFEAAKIRGNKIEQAAKAIVLKIRKKKSKEYEFIQCIVSGHKKIDLKKLKSLLELDNASLASPEEVLEKTNCTVGSVPPFGLLLGIKTYMDSSILENEFIFFSAGTHNDSIKMKSKDYVDALKPEIMEFCSENTLC